MSQYCPPRSPKQNPSRRGFLRATLLTASLVKLGPGCTSGDDEDTRPLQDGTEYFPQSVVSGDPRPDSVIVWTRVEDPDLGEDDVDVTVQLATDAEFTALVDLEGETSRRVAATAMYDRCVKAKIKGLEPATTYYYRFIHSRDDGRFVSPVGRTRTAPAADADAKLRFAVVSCQDFNGRYYNGYARLAAEELDFVIHLGDYIYETTGDPSFQQTTGRVATFTDKAGAIVFNEGTDKEYFAARSLSNYRELYRTYRSDPALRKVHEAVPFICTWDDHEFSDDGYGDVATYYDGRKDETDPDRRKAASQAWFEYMPVDFQDEDFAYDPSVELPNDITIYRDFVFGKHMHLVMTDLRSRRVDHLIAEDAYPGAVVLTQAELMAELGELPAAASEYVDIDSFAGGAYKKALVAAAAELEFDPAKITGLLDVQYINSSLAKLKAPAVEPIVDLAGLERGYAYRHLGKLSTHASIGSRYLVIKEPFDLWARVNYKKSGGKTQEVMGEEQQAWFLKTMKEARETWKIWGNEYCLVPLVINLTPLPIAPFNQIFYMNVDQWDGMRDRRDALLSELVKLDNVVALTGDIHAFYAGIPGLNADPTQHIAEFVTSGMSSGTFRTQLVLQVASDPILSATPGASDLAASIDSLFQDTGTNRHLAYADSERNGFMIVELDGKQVVTTYLAIEEKEILVDHEKLPAAELAALFTSVRFKVEAGSRELYMEVDGAWKRWDYDKYRYV